jgi:hypothetical protein
MGLGLRYRLLAIFIVGMALFVSYEYSACRSGTYYADASPVPRLLHDKLGDSVRVYQLGIYPDYVRAKVQDRVQGSRVDAYTMVFSAFGDPTSVKLEGNAATASAIDAAVIDLDTIDFTAVPKMATDAVAQSNVAQGHVMGMVLERDETTHNARWRVEVRRPAGPTGNGLAWVDYDLSGNLLKVKTELR